MGSRGTHRIPTGATVIPTAGGSDVERWTLGNGVSRPACGEAGGWGVGNIHLAFDSGTF